MLRSAKQANEDAITDVAAALAYYAFLAIPAALLMRSASSAARRGRTRSSR